MSETRTVRRRSFSIALAVAVATALAACGGDGDDAAADGDLTEVVFAQPVPQSVIQWPSYVADQLGYFADEGIAMSLAPASEDVPLPTFVNSGDADLAAAGASEVLFATREGADIRVVMDWWTRSAEGIVAPEDSTVADAEGLVGSTVGVASDEDRAFLAAALGAVGSTLDDVEIVVVGSAGPSVANALKKGDIDAFAGATSDFAALQAAGIALRDVTPEALAATPASSVIVSAEMLENERDVVVGFLRAYAKATYAGLVDAEALAAMSAAAVPEEWREEAAGLALLETVVVNATPDDDARIGDVRSHIWSAAQQQLLDVGELEKPEDLDTILTDELIEEINDFDRAEVEADVAAWMEANA